MVTPDILTVLKSIVKIFDECSIPYYIGGSIASSIYGLPRATMDIDIVADIQVNHISRMKDSLEKDYYIDENMITDWSRKFEIHGILIEAFHDAGVQLV